MDDPYGPLWSTHEYTEHSLVNKFILLLPLSGLYQEAQLDSLSDGKHNSAGKAYNPAVTIGIT
jgi:hypothetical protein